MLFERQIAACWLPLRRGTLSDAPKPIVKTLDNVVARPEKISMFYVAGSFVLETTGNILETPVAESRKLMAVLSR